MKPFTRKDSYAGWFTWALCAVLAFSPARAPAEDIDIFVTDNSASSTFDNPNVLIILDNTSNWSRADQNWPGGVKQGQAELQAIKTVIDGLNSSINVGLMMFTDTGSGREGGYIRFPVLPMTDDTATTVGTKTVFKNLAQQIYNNFGTPLEKSASSANYSSVMFDAFKYFGGYTSPANVASGTAGSPQDATHFGPLIFNQLTEVINSAGGAVAAVQGALTTDTTNSMYPGGYTDGSYSPTVAATTTYRSPLSATNQCAKNYIIFIGNGFPNSDIGSPSPMDTYLSGIGGNTTQLALPNFTTANVATSTPIGYTNACTASCSTTEFAAQCGTGLTYESCSCTGNSKNTLDACPSGQSRYDVLFRSSTSGSVTGPVPGTIADVSASTTSCYATSTAANTAATGGTETGGLANPSATSTGTDPRVDVTYSSTWSVPTSTVASACTTGPYGPAGTPVNTNSSAVIGGGAAGDSSACYLSKSNYVSTDTGGLTCPADTATTHYVCTYALKANPNNGSNSDCPGSGGTQQKRYAITETATPYPILNKYTVVRHTTTATTTTTGSTTATSTLGNSFACYSTAPTGGTSTEFTSPSCPSGSTCSQVYGSATAAAACPSGARWEIQGTNTVSTVVPTNTFAVPPTNKQRMTDEWARYLYQTDVSSVAGQQNVSTYTIDVFNAKQDADQTGLLMSMARVGGGKYFAAKNQDQIVAALRQIMSEIQAVNSVFASASLPVNATNRAQNENQVFIGMFRPDKKPRWYGNVKRYQLANFAGVIDLGDSTTQPDGNPLRAINLQTGFISECATSFWTTDSGSYWSIVPSNPPAETKCTTSTFDKWSDSPDGPLVEKGAAAEVLRKGNGIPTALTSPLTVPWPRNVKTLDLSQTPPVVDFTATVSGLSSSLADFVLGKDVNDENANGINNVPKTTTPNLGEIEVRPSVHGDVVHSRPLPVNYAASGASTSAVTVFYGANDGTLRAVDATNGQERWAFVAPEFFATSTARNKFQRQSDNSPEITFPSYTAASTAHKDYFWDGTIGIYQNADNSDIRIFPTMRRGGRMLYALNVTDSASPTYLWKLGCPNLDNDDNCVAPDSADLADVKRIGQTWSMPSVAFIKGVVNTDPTVLEPVLVMGGGYDTCEDQNTSTPTCSSPKGAAIYVIRARDGKILRTFPTQRSVPSDVAMVDVNNDNKVDYAYVADTGGNLYRLDFVDATSSYAERLPAAWQQYRVAYTNGSGRKFFYPPALLSVQNGYVYAALGSGDREHPLRGDYPYGNVTNRFYVYLDQVALRPIDTDPPPVAPDLPPVNLDDEALMNNFTSLTSCTAERVLPSIPTGKKGWFMDLNQYGVGEQTVTSALILGGLVTFSTNMPSAADTASCSTSLGVARGYWVNLLNGSGGIGIDPTLTCGGSRAGTFVGGGLPPSPVTGTVPVQGVARTVVIGAVQRDGSASAPIGGQKVIPAVKAIRKRVYWFKNVD